MVYDVLIILQFIEFLLLKVNRDGLIISLVIVEQVAWVLLTAVFVGHDRWPHVK